MPPPDMPPSIQKPQKSLAEFGARAADQRVGIEVAGPGNDGLDGAVEIAAACRRRRRRCRPARRWPTTSSRMPMACRRPCHSVSERSRYFSVTISRMGPTSCAMPPCTSTRLCCNFSRVACGTRSVVEDLDGGAAGSRG